MKDTCMPNAVTLEWGTGTPKAAPVPTVPETKSGGDANWYLLYVCKQFFTLSFNALVSALVYLGIFNFPN
jgi:hypothetical protein